MTQDIELYFRMKNAEDIVRLRMVATASTVAAAWDPVSKYAEKKFKVIYFDKDELVAYIKSHTGNPFDLEKAIIHDFSKMYKAIFLELDSAYQELKKLYDKKEPNKKKQKLAFKYGKPEMTVHGIEMSFELFHEIARKHMPRLEEPNITMNFLPEIKERFDKAISCAEAAIKELIKTLSKFYDLEKERLHRRLKILGYFLSLLRAAVTASV